MNTRTDKTPITRPYELRCVDCSFEMNVEEDILKVLDIIDAHQEEHTVDALEHFVEVES